MPNKTLKGKFHLLDSLLIRGAGGFETVLAQVSWLEPICDFINNFWFTKGSTQPVRLRRRVWSQQLRRMEPTKETHKLT